MIGLNNISAPQDVATLADLVELLAHPERAAAVIAEFQAAANDLRAQREQMQAMQKEFGAEQTAHTAQLKTERAAHDAALTQAQSTFDQNCLSREVSLSAREKRLSEAETKLAADQAALLDGRQALARRLQLLQQATAVRLDRSMCR
jgi:hypothetical protein